MAKKNQTETRKSRSARRSASGTTAFAGDSSPAHPEVRRSVLSRMGKKNSSRTHLSPVFHLSWYDDGSQWKVMKKGGQRASFVSEDRSEALKKAKEIAREKCGTLITHAKNGKIMNRFEMSPKKEVRRSPSSKRASNSAKAKRNSYATTPLSEVF